MDRNDALKTLKEGDAGSRILAARELRRSNDLEVKIALADALGDPAPDVRNAASRSLMEIGDAATVPLLIPLLRRGSPAVRNGARQVLEQLCRIEPQALVALAADGDPRMRVFAANIMGGTGDHEFVPPLLGMLGDRDPNVVEAAMSALGQLGAREGIAGLTKIAANSDPWMRFSAIDALGRIPDPAAARALLDLLATAEEDLLDPLVDSLGRQGDRAAVLPLVALLDSRPGLRSTLLRVLLGPLAPHVASLGRDPRLEALARAASEALKKNQIPARLATMTTVLLAAIGGGENS